MKLLKHYLLKQKECKSYSIPIKTLPIPNPSHRFRWASCQISSLQRLKGESQIIRNALANLPKTLDETYERIFLQIPKEDREFVHHALKWIYYHNELLAGDISSSLLLRAIE